MLFKIWGERHHNVEANGARAAIIDCEPDQAELEAFKHVFTWSIGYDIAECPAIADVLKDALRMVKNSPRHEVRFDFEDEGERYPYVLWYYPPGTGKPKNERLNFGFGPSSDGTTRGASKYDNSWVYCEPWVRDNDRYQELLKLTKKELADKICRLESI